MRGFLRAFAHKSVHRIAQLLSAGFQRLLHIGVERTVDIGYDPRMPEEAPFMVGIRKAVNRDTLLRRIGK